MMQIGMAECGQCGERRECYSGDNGAECGACYVDAIAHGAMHGSFADYDDETSVERVAEFCGESLGRTLTQAELRLISAYGLPSRSEVAS